MRLPAEPGAIRLPQQSAGGAGTAAGRFPGSRAAAAASVGAARRVGVFMGTSTAGILQTELAYRASRPRRAARCRRASSTAPRTTPFRSPTTCGSACRSQGPPWRVSSACASSAKVFGSARRMIEAGFIDAALVGGVDSLCLTTLYGFHSLQLSSRAALPAVRCGARRHFHRRGGGVRAARARAGTGSGRRRCAAARRRRVERCLPHVGAASRRPRRAARHAGRARGRRARCRRHRLHQSARHRHARATTARKARRSPACSDPTTPCSSTKGATGHTLGAAGALEAVISALALRTGLMPGGVHTTHIDPTLTAHYMRDNRRAPISARALQFLRIRRHELQPDLRSRGMSIVGLRRRPRSPGAGIRQLARSRGGAGGPTALSAGRRRCCRRRRLLAAAERRRTGRVVKLALAIALEATAHAGFGSQATSPACSPPRAATGTTAMNSARPGRSPSREISPTRFANSVHNAAAGYWSIGTGRHGRIQRAVRLRRQLHAPDCSKP